MTLTVSQPQEYTDSQGQTRTRWQRLGVAFKNRDGQSLTVVLNALPMPQNGEVRLVVQPKQEQRQDHQNQDGVGSQAPQQRQAPARQPDYDDNIPF